MAGVIVPVAKTVYVCDAYSVDARGRVDLRGLFDTIRPPSWPHVPRAFVCFAQFTGGLGNVPFRVDVRHADTDLLMYRSPLFVVQFPDRQTIQRAVVTIRGFRFARSGLYLVEYFANNTWVADTVFELVENTP